MTLSLKHSFTSAKADGTDSTLVQPSAWNAEHTITLAAGKVLGRDSSGAGAAQELPLSFDTSGNVSMSATGYFIPAIGTTAQRPTGSAGMIRYNTSLSKIELYNGTAWGSVGGGATTSDTAPSSPASGDLWWKSDEGQLYIYYTDPSGSQWVTANSFAGGPSYLPLAGGTLTGALNGVNAAFSGTVAMGTSFKRNRIINGDMRVAQRGTSFSTPANVSYTLDRWIVTWVGAAPATVAQVTGPTGYQNALQITGAAGNTQAYISQRIESFNIADLAGTTVTLSSTISVSSAQTILWAAYYPTAVDNYTTFTNIATGTWSATTSATRFTAQISLPSGAANGLWILFYPQNTGAFTSGTMTLTGVQVEPGSVATPYEMQIYSDQLAQCQRYYKKYTSEPIGWARDGYTTPYGVSFKVTMRATPTIEAGATFAVSTGSAGTVTAAGVGGLAALQTPDAYFFGNASGNWTTNAGILVTAGLSAEL